MIFYPYHKYVLTSKLSSEQLKRKFDRAPQLHWSDDPAIRTMAFANRDNTYRYDCDLYRKYLKVEENNDNELGGRKKIKPEAKITFKDSGYETVYTIKIRVNLWVKLFVIFAMTGVSAGCIYAISDEMKKGNSSFQFIIPFAILIFFYIQVVRGFIEQKSRFELFIDDLLETRPLA